MNNNELLETYKRIILNTSFILGIYFLCSSASYGQTQKDSYIHLQIDSIKRVLKVEKSQAARIDNMVALSKLYTEDTKTASRSRDSALVYSKKLVRLGEQLNDLEIQIKGIALHAKVLRLKRKYDDAISLLEKKIEETAKNTEGIPNAILYKSLGETYKDRGFHIGKISDLTDAYTNFEIASNLGSNHLNTNELVEIFFNQATIKHYTYENEESVKILLNVIKKYENNSDLDLSLLSKIYVNLGMDYLKLEQEEKAVSALEKALTLDDSTINNCRAYRVLGEISESKKEIKEANLYYKKALKLIEGIDNTQMYALSEHLGNTSVQLKDYESGIIYYKKAIEVAKKFPAIHSRLSIPSLFGLGSVYYKNGQLQESKRIIEQVIEFLTSKEDGIVQHGNYREVLRDGYLLMSQINEKQKQYEEGLLNYKQHVKIQSKIEQIKDSIFNLEKLKTIEELQLTFETEKKDIEISTLKANSNLQELKSKQQRNFVIGLIIGSTLLIILLFSVLKSLHLKRRAHNIIKEKYEENQLLMGEIHHRVKNNLQIIISLLNAQINSAKNDKKLQIALKESQTKIKSMAIIHQSLYNSSTYAKVKVNNYFKELLEQLQKTFESDSKVIEFETDVEHKEINMSLAVPLGLIVNELVTNSYKYAFNKICTNKKKVSVYFKSMSEPRSYKLKVLDNGVGLPDDFDMENLSSFGIQLVKGLVEQLSGTITITETEGTGFEIYVTEPQAA